VCPRTHSYPLSYRHAAQGCWVIGEGTWQFEQAISAATGADAVLVFVGSSSKRSNLSEPELLDVATEKESLDRTSIDLPGVQMDLIRALALRTTTPIIVVLVNGGPLAVDWAAASDRVGAMLVSWYPGQYGAQAISDVLFGDFSPSGLLPVTFYFSNYTSQISMTSMDMRSPPGRTHRYLSVPALYEFGMGSIPPPRVSHPAVLICNPAWRAGHGLAYTSFAFSDPQVTPLSCSSRCTRTVSVNLTNTGSRASHRSVLFFAHRESSSAIPDLPVRELLGFRRVQLDPGASVRVEISLLADDDRPSLRRDARAGIFPSNARLLSARGCRQVRIGDAVAPFCVDPL
jgi:beta-glucosidase